jgi:hypothetical protein
VDPDTGLVGMDYVFEPSGRWGESGKQSLGNLLLQIQHILHEPNLDCILNLEAATAYVKKPNEIYCNMVLECVATSRRLFWSEEDLISISSTSRSTQQLIKEISQALDFRYGENSGKYLITKEEAFRQEQLAIHITYDPQYTSLVETRERELRTKPSITRLDYESYWNTWKGMATSKPAPESINPRKSC